MPNCHSITLTGFLILVCGLWTAPDRLSGAFLDQDQDRESSADPDPSRFSAEIAAFERADAAHSPSKGGIVFVGSSSIRRWDLKSSFPDDPALNRGFGGSHLSDVIAFADRIVLPYQPGLVVLYAGDNDIASGKSPEQVADDFRQLVTIIHDALPETRIVFLSIKPSLARWNLWERMNDANTLIRQSCGENDRLEYVDIASPMLGLDGTPRPELFAEDGLHLSDQGYALWSRLLRPILEEETLDH